MSKDNNTQPEEVNIEETAEETVETPVEEVQETLGDTLGSIQEADKPKGKPETVPINVFLDLKKELKEMKASLKQAPISESSIEKLAEEFPDVDPSFIQKLAGAIENSTAKKMEEKYSTKISELENVSKRETQEKKFNDLYEKTLDSMPYFKDVANKEVLKQLAMNPENASKTFPQLMEEVYGSSVQGKKTMETAQPNAGRAEEGVDFSQAGNPAVYARIKSDPKLFKQYNEYVQRNLNI